MALTGNERCASAGSEDLVDGSCSFNEFFHGDVDDEIFGNIGTVLGCKRFEVCDIYPLKQGLTNLSCHFRAGDGAEYVYRHPGVGTEELVDRSAEMAAQNLARDLGLDRTFVAGDPARGWKISRFVPNCRQLDPHDPAQMARAMRMARELHEARAKVERRFDFFEEGKRYESLLLRHGAVDVAGYDDLARAAERLKRFADADGCALCLSHNDFFHLNFLIDEDDAYSLIDWEYSGMSDYASDFGTCVVCCELSEDEARGALEQYFGRTPTFEEVRHNFAYVGLAGWCWYVWSLVKEAEGDCVGEWLGIYHRYAKEYMARALSWYEGTAHAAGCARLKAVEVCEPGVARVACEFDAKEA